MLAKECASSPQVTSGLHKSSAASLPMGSARRLVTSFQVLKTGSPARAFPHHRRVQFRSRREVHSPAVRPHSGHLPWLLLVCTDLVLSYFSTNFSLGKEKKGRLPDNSEALVEPFQAFPIRETFTIKSTDKTNHYTKISR